MRQKTILAQGGEASQRGSLRMVARDTHTIVVQSVEQDQVRVYYGSWWRSRRKTPSELKSRGAQANLCCKRAEAASQRRPVHAHATARRACVYTERYRAVLAGVMVRIIVDGTFIARSPLLFSGQALIEFRPESQSRVCWGCHCHDCNALRTGIHRPRRECTTHSSPSRPPP